MLRQFIYLLAVVMMTISCTAFKHTLKAKGDSTISRQEVYDLAVNDEVFVKLKKGQSLRGRITDLNDEYFVVGYDRNKSQTLYYQTLSKIKYKEDVPLTILNTIVVVVIVPIILFLLFPPIFSVAP